MCRTNKTSALWNNALSQAETEIPSSQKEVPNSDQESDPEASFYSSMAQQAISNMSMLHIECPKINWTVNDAPYHRFLKWCLNCENILECGLAALLDKNVRR